MDTNLKQWIKTKYSYHSHPFLDNFGRVVIGYKRPLDTLGIRPDEADLMLTNDLNYIRSILNKQDWFLVLPESAKDGITIICIEIGLANLLLLEDLIKALKNRDWTRASIETIKCKWTSDYKNTIDVALMIREGHEDPH